MRRCRRPRWLAHAYATLGVARPVRRGRRHRISADGGARRRGRVYGAILGAAGITVLRDQLQNLVAWLFGHTGNFLNPRLWRGAGAGIADRQQRISRSVQPLLPPKPPTPRDGDALPAAALPEPGVRIAAGSGRAETFGGLVAVNDVNFEV